jgi:sulfonate transport system permease protein
MSSFALGTPSRAPARVVEVGRGLVLPLLLLVAWELSTRFGLVNLRLLVRPSLVLSTFLRELKEGELLSQLAASIARDLSGAVLGSSVGVVAGTIMGTSRRWEHLLGSTFHAAKQVAIFAWIPLMSVWLGSGEPAKIVFIALSAFYPVVLNTFEGIRSVGREYIEVTTVFRFSRAQVLFKVILPGALPSILAGIQLALIYSWLATIGAEYLLAPGPGLGNLMIDGREQFQMDKVLVGVALVGLVGCGISAAASALGSSKLRWRSTGAG